MPTRVRFRFNKLTGEVEEFLVDDQDQLLSEAEHDRRALAVGQVLAVRPRVDEVLPGARPEPDPPREAPRDEAETEPARQDRRS